LARALVIARWKRRESFEASRIQATG